MKHQYFGDVNDYRKYGLLRVVQRRAGLRLGVCWMLTPDDGRSDGKFTRYLSEPLRWRHHDPELFDALAACVPQGRSIAHVADRALLRGAVFAEDVVPDRATERQGYFSEALRHLQGSELVFLDPDNGLEVPSCPMGRKGSSKYALWSELAEAYRGGRSVLVYQHFRREERSEFVVRMAADIGRRVGAPSPSCFLTSNVAFFLVPQPAHEPALRSAADEVVTQWRGQIGYWPGNTAIV